MIGPGLVCCSSCVRDSVDRAFHWKQLDSASSAKLDNVAAVTFGRPTCRELFKLAYGLALRGYLQTQFAASHGLAVEGLRNWGRAARFAKLQNLYFKFSSFIDHPQHSSDMDFACGLGRLPVGMNPAEVAGPRSQRSRLEKSGGPKPLVNSYGSHLDCCLARRH